MRIVGFDVSRSVAEIAYLEDGTLHAGGRTGLRRDELERFAEKLRATDHVMLEATGNTAAIVNVLRRLVARVAIANPLQVRLIAEARVKTDKIDAAVLAQLYASGFLPEVWMPDEHTLALRRQISRRSQLVRQRTRLKNEIHAVLAAHLIERCPATDLFGKKGVPGSAFNRFRWTSDSVLSSGCANWTASPRICARWSKHSRKRPSTTRDCA
nr:transposase [Burkholderia sp. BE17]